MPRAATAPGWGRRWLARAALIAAFATIVAGVFAAWVDRQLLDTPAWTGTSTRLLENKEIRGQVAGFVTDELYAQVNDIGGGLQVRLPKLLKPLGAPAAAALHDLVATGTAQALASPRVRRLWRSANALTHRQFVTLIENRGSALRLPGGGAVVLDLRPLVGLAAERVGLPTAGVVGRLPGDVARLRVLRADQLTTMQKVAKALNGLAVWLPILSVLLLMIAVGLARGRRREALQSAGIAIVGAGLLVLALRALAGSSVADTLAASDRARPAARAAWTIATSLLAEIAGATIVSGVPVVLAAMLAGPSRPARRGRRALAPLLAERPAFSFALVAAALGVVRWWAPIPATRHDGWMLYFAALAFLGTALLRRQVVAESRRGRATSPGAIGS